MLVGDNLKFTLRRVETIIVNDGRKIECLRMKLIDSVMLDFKFKELRSF